MVKSIKSMNNTVMTTRLYLLVLLCFGTLVHADESFTTLNSAISAEKSEELFKYLSDPRLSIYSKFKNIEDLGVLDELFEFVLTEHSKNHESVTKEDIAQLKSDSLEEWEIYSNSSFQNEEATNQFKDFIQPIVERYLDLDIEIPEESLKNDYGLVAYFNNKLLVDSLKLPEDQTKALNEVLNDKTRSKPILVKEFAETYSESWPKVLDLVVEKVVKEKKVDKAFGKVLKNLWKNGNGDGNYYRLYPELAKISKFNKETRATFDSLHPVTAQHINEILSLATVINNEIKLDEEIANPLVIGGVAKVVKFALKSAFDKLKEAKKDTKGLVTVLKDDKVTLFHKFYNVSKALPEENVLQSGTKELEQSGLDKKVMRSFETLVKTYVSQNGKATYFSNRGLTEEDANLFLVDVLNKMTTAQLEQLKGLVPGAKKGLEEFVAEL
ncbi:unnamed protein product [Bursaphelenchus okinawaensis]|uniref:Fatty-acid and retinol-binding protein 1 n=1 Tax=Bursaphelenchus okinawaensis TaxID=465554 RepID=A0A811KE44_9BILA|nr:unnamed protein product [Bursaphelenchus okinawaensis]CAG9103000.1 unnamed protein product [Bursaphelenchus okinawaensis]